MRLVKRLKEKKLEINGLRGVEKGEKIDGTRRSETPQHWVVTKLSAERGDGHDL